MMTAMAIHDGNSDNNNDGKGDNNNSKEDNEIKNNDDGGVSVPARQKTIN